MKCVDPIAAEVINEDTMLLAGLVWISLVFGIRAKQTRLPSNTSFIVADIKKELEKQNKKRTL